MTSHLFSSFKLRKEIIANRIVIAPMCQYAASTDGLVNDWHYSHYLQLAVSGADMLVIESTSISEDGCISDADLCLYNDQHFLKMTEFVKTLKSWSSAKIGIQLSHAGRKGANPSVPIARGRVSGRRLVSASPIPLTNESMVPRELFISELESISNSYEKSAQYALDAGFDFVEIHMAHGYLLHQFLSPLSNLRADEYGGSLEGRMKFPLEVFKKVSKVWANGKFLGARITGMDWLDGGIEIGEAVALAENLKLLGADYVCVSSGGIIPITNMVPVPMYQVPLANTIKKTTGICTRAVGLITNYEQAESVIASEMADLVALGRGLLRNPRWVWEASRRAGVEIDVPYPYRRIYRDYFSSKNLYS
jgi:2,4-dienoyl-CoA reductase-like NADH-dependent reductase (Old Yellow Enzyme family)